MKPAILKDIAKSFAKKYYPRYEDETDRIWKILEETNLDKTRVQERVRQGESLGLAFGAGADPELNEMVSAMITFYLAHKDIKDKENITKKELLDLITEICSLLKINSGFKEKAESVLDLVLSDEKKPDEYARIWTSKTGVNGEPIDRKRFDELIANKDKHEGIFIIDRGEYERNAVGEVYFNNQPVFKHPIEKSALSSNRRKTQRHLTPLEYRILVYTLKANGSPGEIINIVKECWLTSSNVNSLKDYWQQVVNGQMDKVDFLERASGYRKAISGLSTFLYEVFSIDLKTRRTGSYSLSKEINYNVIALN